MEKLATKPQISYFHGLTRKEEMKTERANLVMEYSGYRTDDPKEMTVKEMAELISDLKDQGESSKQRKKIFSLAHQAGWTKGNRPDYERINGWMLKYSYLHKDLNAYTLDELPKLITQFEKMVASQLTSP